MSRHPYYNTARWQRKRARQKRDHPICAYCQQEGIITPATVADHVIPHHGDEELFWSGQLQSLCDQCHNSTKAKEEHKGYDHRVGEDGRPIDPRHPFNAPDA